MNGDHVQTLRCPVCNQQTDSLKQLRVIETIFAFPIGAAFSSNVIRGCPPCMRAFVWRRCLVNGLTTWIVGYIVLVPYTLALTVGTLSKGHSWPVTRGITPEMQLNRTWTYKAHWLEKVLAIIAVPMCVLPGIGILVCWGILWKLRWCTGWVYKTAEIASFVAYFVTIAAIGLSMKIFLEKPRK